MSKNHLAKEKAEKLKKSIIKKFTSEDEETHCPVLILEALANIITYAIFEYDRMRTFDQE